MQDEDNKDKERMIRKQSQGETEILFDCFATLTAAPGGIAKLRELILQLAVQGKLVPQNPEDEPASVLLERIKAEKALLMKEGKIKKSKPFTPINEDDIPYKVPKGWEWVIIGNVLFEAQPGFASGKRDSNGIIQLRMNNVNTKGGFVWDKIIRIPKDEAKNIDNYLLNRGDILFNNTNSVELVGKSAVFDSFAEPIVYSNHFTRLRVYNGKPDPRFIALWINQLWNSKLFENLCTRWIGQSAVNRSKLLALAFPLPPLPEQHRIVEKVDALMELCDELEARQMKQREMQAKLGVAALASLTEAEDAAAFADAWARICYEFNLIFDTVENVTALRQAILQLAVQGKLVPQNPEDEPAHVLLERIKAEKARLVKEGKIKKSKALPPVAEDEVPFEVPKGWMWVQLGNIVLNRDSERIPLSRTERETRKGPYEYYGASGVIDHIDDYLFDKPLLLLGEDGANLLNRSTPIAFIAKGKYWVNNHAHVLDSISTEFLNYISLFINAIDLRPYVTGTAQPKMNQAKMNSIPIAIPPTNEQMKIITKVDAIMALCDELEQRIQKRQETQTKLLESVVAQITA